MVPSFCATEEAEAAAEEEEEEEEPLGPPGLTGEKADCANRSPLKRRLPEAEMEAPGGRAPIAASEEADAAATPDETPFAAAPPTIMLFPMLPPMPPP